MSDQPPSRRWPIWKILLLAVAVFVLYVIGSTFNVYRKIPESYAAWTTGNLIVDYLNTYSNQWPRSWEDLDKATNCLRYTPIESLRTTVKINWTVNFEDLLLSAATNHATPLKLVTRPDGSKLHAKWGPGTEPNNKIKGYLLWHLSQSNRPTQVQ